MVEIGDKKKIFYFCLFLLVLLISCSKLRSYISEAQAGANIDKQIQQQPVVSCGSGTQLMNSKCVVIINDGNKDNPTLSPTPLTPDVSTPNIVCREPSGVFTSLYYRQRNFLTATFSDVDDALIWGTFRYQGNCKTNIYIEAGIPNAIQSISPLTIAPPAFGYVSGSPSTCDGNVHYNGVVFKDVEPQATVKFILKPKNYGVEGTYPLKVGAYTGCTKDGGFAMQELSGLVGFSNSYTLSTSDPNSDILLSYLPMVEDFYK